MNNFKSLVKNVGFQLLAPSDQPSRWTCDVLIPCLDKDAEALEFCLSCLRKNLRHPIGEIFILSPPSVRIQQCAQKHQAIWIDEEVFMGFSAAALDVFPSGKDRRGWIYQQLIKLNGDRLGSSEWLFLLDADTALIRPQSFERKGRLLVQFSESAHQPYRDNLKVLLPSLKLDRHPFVCNHLFLRKSVLAEVKQELEKVHGKDWIHAIVDSLDLQQISGFSEYELLGHFLSDRRKGEIVHAYFRYAAMAKRLYEKSRWKQALMPLFFRNISFHSYL